MFEAVETGAEIDVDGNIFTRLRDVRAKCVKGRQGIQHSAPVLAARARPALPPWKRKAVHGRRAGLFDQKAI